MLKAGWWLFYGRVLVRDEGREGGGLGDELFKETEVGKSLSLGS
jgi:hypothetical protein